MIEKKKRNIQTKNQRLIRKLLFKKGNTELGKKKEKG